MNEIHTSEIWTKTDCLKLEDDINYAFRDKMVELGYSLEFPAAKKFLNGNNHQVVLSLVDDFRSLANDYTPDTPFLFDKNTSIITDNYTICPTPYNIVRIPESFFGIYSYMPEDQNWQPDRDFSFSVNRIDHMRFHLMLELGWRIHLHKGYVNFNCEVRHADGTMTAIERSPAAWLDMWGNSGPELRSYYQKSYETLAPQMPVKNYDCSHEKMQVSSFLNIIVETYHGDNNIALSEKIFRALLTPVPWTLFGGRYSVAWLESMGFDCLSDLIEHNHYDRLKNVENKVNIFIWKSLESVKQLKMQHFDNLKARCLDAARHNYQVLKNMQDRWPSNFSNFLNNLPNQLYKKPIGR